MNPTTTDRRAFVLKTSAAMAVALVPTIIGSVDAVAEEQQGKMMAGHIGSDGYVMPTSGKECGTCEFWGGARRISKDGKSITFIGLGWCNNAKCPGYQGMSSPDHQCQQGACWRKWNALG